jgi:hypothetical protein
MGKVKTRAKTRGKAKGRVDHEPDTERLGGLHGALQSAANDFLGTGQFF